MLKVKAKIVQQALNNATSATEANFFYKVLFAELREAATRKLCRIN